MIFKSIRPKVGDTVRISEWMSLRYDKIAQDLSPVWYEIPPVESSRLFEEGNYLSVTSDIWFVFDHGQWRIMSLAEHVEARRQILSPEI